MKTAMKHGSKSRLIDNDSNSRSLHIMEKDEEGHDKNEDDDEDGDVISDLDLLTQTQYSNNLMALDPNARSRYTTNGAGAGIA